MMKTALERMIQKQSNANHPAINPPISVPTPSTSSPSSSNCVFVTDKKPRRKSASENFAVANSQTKSGQFSCFLIFLFITCIFHVFLTSITAAVRRNKAI
jgi:hypothetical protein